MVTIFLLMIYLQVVLIIFLLLIYFLLLYVLFVNPITKKWFYPKSSIKHFEAAVNEFDKNKKALDEIDVSKIKFGRGHIYE